MWWEFKTHKPWSRSGTQGFPARRDGRYSTSNGRAWQTYLPLRELSRSRKSLPDAFHQCESLWYYWWESLLVVFHRCKGFQMYSTDVGAFESFKELCWMYSIIASAFKNLEELAECIQSLRESLTAWKSLTDVFHQYESLPVVFHRRGSLLYERLPDHLHSTDARAFETTTDIFHRYERLAHVIRRCGRCIPST